MLRTMDNYGRWRSVTVAFRMSEEERDLLDAKVRLSGLSKQDYIIHRLLGWEVKVFGNPKVYKALKNQMNEILDELKRIEAGQIMDDDLLELIHIVSITLNDMKEDSPWM